MQTLADKVRDQRAAKLHRKMRDDFLHGRTDFPDLEADGADAFAHSYPASACPYANRQTVDAAGFIAQLPTDEIAKAAAWRRGWMRAAINSPLITSDTPRLRFWERLNVCLAAHGIAEARYCEARDFFDFGDINPERVAAFWSADFATEA